MHAQTHSIQIQHSALDPSCLFRFLFLKRKTCMDYFNMYSVRKMLSTYHAKVSREGGGALTL